MFVRLSRFVLISIAVLLIFSAEKKQVVSAQTSYICGYSTSGVLQSGMIGYPYPYIIACATGEKIGWGNLGVWGMGKHVQINEPVIIEITPVRLNDGTVISREIRNWADYFEIPDCNACSQRQTTLFEEQGNPICGWIENNSGTGALAPTLTVWKTKEIIDLALLEPEFTMQLMSLGIPGYFRVYDPVFYQTGFMANFSRIEKVDSCEVLETPMPPPSTSPVLEISGVQIEPSQVSVFDLVKITVIIENRGSPLNQPLWGYVGEVVLEDENGEMIERHSFAKGDASFISPVVEGGQVNFEKWLLTVKVRFGTAVSNGRVIVSLQPNVPQQSELREREIKH